MASASSSVSRPNSRSSAVDPFVLVTDDHCAQPETPDNISSIKVTLGGLRIPRRRSRNQLAQPETSDNTSSSNDEPTLTQRRVRLKTHRRRNQLAQQTPGWKTDETITPVQTTCADSGPVVIVCGNLLAQWKVPGSETGNTSTSNLLKDSFTGREMVLYNPKPNSETNTLIEENEVPSIFRCFLPVVKKYFLFSEALALSFLQPMELVTLTSKGKEIINEKEGISVHVADDTVPVGRILHLELGSSMHGRLSFPTNVSPVSPILWICPQEDIPLLKPIKITLPHTVKYEEGTSELVFMKAHHEMRHETPLIMPTSTEYRFEFEEIVHHEGVNFNKTNGSIFTKQFCPLCIAKKVLEPTCKRYKLLRTQPKNNNTSRFSIDYCVVYTLPTCLESFDNLCKKWELEVRHNWPEFTFTLDEMTLRLSEPQATSGWIVEIECMKNTIKESEVDFWQYEVDLLKQYQEERFYPPRITIHLYRNGTSNARKLDVHFSGTNPPLQDSIILLPESTYYSTGWRQKPLYTGKETREYITFRQNLSSMTDALFSVPQSKDKLCIKLIEESWLDVTANPSEKELVLLALNRIEADSRTFYAFVMMLCEISGMDLVAKNMTSKLQECRV